MKIVNDTVLLFQSYCHLSMESRVAYGLCAKNRVGTLCGRCKEGYSELQQSTECVLNEQCGIVNNWTAVVLLLVFGLLFVLFFMFEPDYEGYFLSILLLLYFLYSIL